MGNPSFCWKGYLYVVHDGERQRLGLSHRPSLDRCFWEAQGAQYMELISPQLNLGTAFFLKDYLQSRWPTKSTPGKVEEVLRGASRRWGISLEKQAAPPPFSFLPDEEELSLVRRIITGRILLLEEVARALRENKVMVTANLPDLLHYLYLRGECELWPAVGFNSRGQPLCRRCGQGDRLFKATCAACESSDCYVCEGCLELGEARTCRPLYARPSSRSYEIEISRPVQPRLSFSLTRAQQDAALQARKFVAEGKGSSCLLWAACGAGKTEVAYWAIAAALSQGREVLYTSPRREVVREIYPRLRQTFPDVKMTILHGESGQKYTPAELVVATAHQVLRCYRHFDLIILDEVDAFPLAGDPRLYYGLERCRRPSGQVLYLSATPPRELALQARRGQIPVIYLPARYHGYPLPEPQLIIDRALRRPGGRLPRPVAEALSLSLNQDRAAVMVFVPTVSLVPQVVEWLLKSLEVEGPKKWIKGLHAGSPEREEVLTAFRQGDFPVLVTTTLLERGITLARLNVMVLFADHRGIFDENTLVQIAGRAGRTAEYPGGRVWFVASKITPEMAEASSLIRRFNYLAAQKGYLRPGKD